PQRGPRPLSVGPVPRPPRRGGWPRVRALRARGGRGPARGAGVAMGVHGGGSAPPRGLGAPPGAASGYGPRTHRRSGGAGLPPGARPPQHCRSLRILCRRARQGEGPRMSSGVQTITQDWMGSVVTPTRIRPLGSNGLPTRISRHTFEGRVLVVAPLYHTDRGGQGRQAVLLTERLAEHGIKLE